MVLLKVRLNIPRFLLAFCFGNRVFGFNEMIVSLLNLVYVLQLVGKGALLKLFWGHNMRYF